MSERKPNHICKNSNCHRGVDGGRKHYYACDYCDRIENWRSVACSFECWTEYQKQVLDARSKNHTINLLPERSDKSNSEIKELMEKPVQDVLDETKDELNDYLTEDATSTDIANAVDKINNQIEHSNSGSKKEKSKSTKKAMWRR